MSIFSRIKDSIFGKKEEARNTLQEMINRADLKEKPETKEAQRLIATL